MVSLAVSALASDILVADPVDVRKGAQRGFRDNL